MIGDPSRNEWPLRCEETGNLLKSIESLVGKLFDRGDSAQLCQVLLTGQP